MRTGYREELRRIHITLVDQVNPAQDTTLHSQAEEWVWGFRRALDVLGILGEELIACDLHYLNQGIDRPMCGGAFLDWQPTEEYNQK